MGEPSAPQGELGFLLFRARCLAACRSELSGGPVGSGPHAAELDFARISESTVRSTDLSGFSTCSRWLRWGSKTLLEATGSLLAAGLWFFT